MPAEVNGPRNYVEHVREIKRRKQTKRRRKFLTVILSLLFVGFILYVWSGLPSLEELENPHPQLASKVISIDGEVIGQFYIENRFETDIDSVPQHLINALIATEDRRFYDHWGVDMTRIFTATIKNIFTFRWEGASTITQQLSKNLYRLKSANENIFETMTRKIREWITSIQIEKNFTKREILELYFTVSFFGKSAYGLESASRIYFNKKAKNLTINEGALLIALLKSPVVYDPEKRPENALRRRNLVLRNMVDAGYLPTEEYAKLSQADIKLAADKGKRVRIRSDAPHFLEYIRQQIESEVEKQGYDLFRDGLSIYTTIDSRMQQIANKVVTDHLTGFQAQFNKYWRWEQNQSLLKALIEKDIQRTPQYENAGSNEAKRQIAATLRNDQRFIDSVKKAELTVQVGFIVLDPRNGQIRAMVGGSNYDMGYGLNHVTQIRRQPGSGFKPFTYAVAINKGYPPTYPLLNEKFNYNGWSPDNSSGGYGGYMTLREGLARSVNIIAGRMTTSEIAPPSEVAAMAKRCGIKSKLIPYPSIALGTSEVMPIEMAAGFATFANGGTYHEPMGVLKIEDRNGIVIAEYSNSSSSALSAQTTAILTSMMQDVMKYGTGAPASRWFTRPSAGKTGTTQDYADAWFTGFTPQLAGSVWVGFDDSRIKFGGSYGQGALAALPIWARFMGETYRRINMPLQYFSLPSGVVSADFCTESILQGEAALANPGCPSVQTDLILADKEIPHCRFHGNSPINLPPITSPSGKTY